MSHSIDEILLQETNSIRKMSNRVFYYNKSVFQRVGLDHEDIKSILDAYTFQFIDKYGEEKRKFLHKFLKHRSLNLIKVCLRKSKKIVENGYYSAEILTSYTHNDNPEEILIAKESVLPLLKE